MAAPRGNSVLFVCLGNICRSPIAEAVFKHLLKQRGIAEQWYVDSAATSRWELGNDPDYRGQSLMRKKDIKMSHKARQWQVDSAGIINMHAGRSPDERGQQLMRSKGISMNHQARQITREDFGTFQYIFGMDEDNIRNIKRVKPKDSTAVVKLLGEYDPQKVRIIEDPYYGEDDDFETVFQQVSRCCTAFLDEVTE